MSKLNEYKMYVVNSENNYIQFVKVKTTFIPVKNRQEMNIYTFKYITFIYTCHKK